MAFFTPPNTSLNGGASTGAGAGAGSPAGVPRRPVGSPAWRHFDLLLVLVTGAVSALGVLMVYSTTRITLEASGGNPESEMKKQAVYAVIGVAAFIVTLFFDYKRYISWAPVLFVGSLLALLATLAIGHKTLGATSWIQFGSIQVEPSELVKVSLILSFGGPIVQPQGLRLGQGPARRPGTVGPAVRAHLQAGRPGQCHGAGRGHGRACC